MTLSGLSLKTGYHKGEDDIASSFYLPCMKRSTLYERAVGFFRSTVYVVAWPALEDFVERGGRMRLLCSHVLAVEDVQALDEGYQARSNEEMAQRLREEIRLLFSEPLLRRPARVLAALVARGTIELRVALMPQVPGRPEHRIFHDKLGLFHDSEGNTVVFKGSMNETWTGLAADGNLESVDVAASWLGGRDAERTQHEMEYFAKLWDNQYQGVLVQEFPRVAKDEIASGASEDWQTELRQIVDTSANGDGQRSKTGERTLWPHQAEALASWRANGRRGILEHATGSGKTYTALFAIREALLAGEVVLVVVPDRILLDQWYSEIRKAMAGIQPRILRCGAGHSAWRQDDLLGPWSASSGEPKIILSTLPTAAKDAFAAMFRGGDHVLLVVDEVHRAGSRRHSRVLQLPSGPRLGLSATPKRAGDPVGTALLLRSFGGILQPRYRLADAIRDGVLCKYFYRAHTVQLTEAESLQWQAYTSKLRQLYAQTKASGGRDPKLAEMTRRLLFQRSDILKGAEGKVDLAARVVRDHFAPGQRWIVYCDDLTQLRRVRDRLTRDGVDSLEYHSQMLGDRRSALKWLESVGGVIVSIRCLDEGVDIPIVSHALILASSKNPREYVQRRGRILRRHPGKALAYIHDAVVLPAMGLRDDPDDPDPVVSGELARAIAFSSGAENPAAATDLERIATDWGIDWETLVEEGMEDED